MNRIWTGNDQVEKENDGLKRNFLSEMLRDVPLGLCIIVRKADLLLDMKLLEAV